MRAGKVTGCGYRPGTGTPARRDFEPCEVRGRANARPSQCAGFRQRKWCPGETRTRTRWLRKLPPCPAELDWGNNRVQEGASGSGRARRRSIAAPSGGTHRQRQQRRDGTPSSISALCFRHGWSDCGSAAGAFSPRCMAHAPCRQRRCRLHCDPPAASPARSASAAIAALSTRAEAAPAAPGAGVGRCRQVGTGACCSLAPTLGAITALATSTLPHIGHGAPARRRAGPHEPRSIRTDARRRHGRHQYRGAEDDHGHPGLGQAARSGPSPPRASSAARSSEPPIVLAGDEDLGNRGAAMGAVDHLGAVRAAHRDVDLSYSACLPSSSALAR